LSFNQLQSGSKLTLDLVSRRPTRLTVVHWFSHQPNAIKTRLQPLSV